MAHIILLDENMVPCAYGCNFNGKLGIGSSGWPFIAHDCVRVSGLPLIYKVVFGVYNTVFLDLNGKVWFCGSRRSVGLSKGYEYFPVPISNIADSIKFVDVDIDSDTTIMLDDQGEIWFCGDSSRFVEYSNPSCLPQKLKDIKKLKDIIFPPKIIQATFAGKNEIILLDNKGKVWSLERSKSFCNWRLSIVSSNLPEITKIITYEGNKILIDIDGCVWAYGYNYYAVLGLDTDMKIKAPTQAQVPAVIVDGSFLAFSAFLIDENGNVWVSGKYAQTNTFLLAPFNFKAVKIIHQGYTNNHAIILVDTESNYWVIIDPDSRNLALNVDYDSATLYNETKINGIKSPFVTSNRFKKTKSAKYKKNF